MSRPRATPLPRRAQTVPPRSSAFSSASAPSDGIAASVRCPSPGASGAGTADQERPWTELAFLAIDVETTGFAPDRDRVIELAWVRFACGRETGRFASLLFSEAEVPEPVRRITGIHAGMLANKPRFVEAASDLCLAIATADFVVAYNARFDRSFLAAELARVKLELPDVPWVDPLLLVRGLLDTGSSKRLADVARRFGVSSHQAHRAESDARVTAELLLRLAPRLQARTLPELLEQQSRLARCSSVRGHRQAPSSATRPSPLERMRVLFR